MRNYFSDNLKQSPVKILRKVAVQLLSHSSSTDLSMQIPDLVGHCFFATADVLYTTVVSFKLSHLRLATQSLLLTCRLVQISTQFSLRTNSVTTRIVLWIVTRWVLVTLFQVATVIVFGISPTNIDCYVWLVPHREVFRVTFRSLIHLSISKFYTNTFSMLYFRLRDLRWFFFFC